MMKPFPDVWKAIAKTKLIELLAALPNDAWIETNEVGNLIVYSAKGDVLGFVDIAFDEYTPFSEALCSPSALIGDGE